MENYNLLENFKYNYQKSLSSNIDTDSFSFNVDTSPFNPFNLRTYDSIVKQQKNIGISDLPEYTEKETPKPAMTQEQIDTERQKYETSKTTGNTSQDYITNRNKIHNYFKTEFGLNNEQISGVMGVLYSESGLNPSVVRKGGTDTGLAQWVGSRKAKAEKLFSKPLKDCSVEEQLEFIKWELKNTHQILDKLKNAKTKEEAAEIWFAGYENGGGGNLVTPQQIQSSYGKHYPGNNDIYGWMIKDRLKNTSKIYNEISKLG